MENSLAPQGKILLYNNDEEKAFVISEFDRQAAKYLKGETDG